MKPKVEYDFMIMKFMRQEVQIFIHEQHLSFEYYFDTGYSYVLSLDSNNEVVFPSNFSSALVFFDFSSF